MADVPSVTFIGAGNIAQAMIQGMLTSDYPAERISAFRRNQDAIAYLGEKGVTVCASLEEAVTGAELVILAVKPWQIIPTAQACSAYLASQACVASVAAGVSIAQLAQALPLHAQQDLLIRLMPNTPVASCSGVIGCYRPGGASEMIEHAFRSLGMLVWLKDEDGMHALTAIAGCGPAYYFRILAHMQDIAAQLGLPAQIGRELALATLRGAASLASQQEDKSFDALVEQIVSKGSATGMALRTFAEHGLSDCLHKGVRAAYERSRQLASDKP